MVKLAIADPPYLGRSVRWYGGGCASGNGKHAADFHPQAAEWDTPERHVQLVHELEEAYDGWAIAAAPDSLLVYLNACPPDVHVMVWHRRNAVPSGARVQSSWEPVIIRIPEGRRGRQHGIGVSDVLDAPVQARGFAGSKPAPWTRWVLAALGFDPSADEVIDIFAGSGAVASELEGMLL